MSPKLELGSRHLSAWQELAERAAEPNPFFEPESLVPAARHLGESDVGLLVVRDSDGDWLACMPVTSRLKVRRGRVPVFTA